VKRLRYVTRVKSVTGRGRKPVVDFELIVLLKWVKRVIVRVMVEWRAVLARAAREGEVDSISVSGEADRAEAIVKVAIVNGRGVVGLHVESYTYVMGCLPSVITCQGSSYIVE
jgi:hypothetical protein